MSVLGRCVCILLWAQSAVGAGNPTSFFRPSTENPTCPSRTINYLTHTLHQQCLPSIRSSSSNSTHTNGSTITSPAISAVGHSETGTGQASDTSNLQSVLRSLSTYSSSHGSLSSRPSLATSISSVTTIRATSLPSAASVPLLSDVADEDSPLESGNFLSFEDWKKDHLIKAGQSEHVGRSARVEQREPRKRPDSVHNTLDSLGDDAEIDLDFSGLVPGGPEAVNDSNQRISGPGDGRAVTGTGSKLKASARGKDAGTTCKERFNYASYDCAANVLKSNSEAKNANHVLRENKDMYMLNKCSAGNKLIILELCEDISIDTIVLANFEFFSSSFRTFRVSVSDRYPIKTDKWKTLGTFEARNTREVQAFLVENPVIWASYVKIEFLTHYGNEFYCPVSLVRVHGTTPMEEYKHDLEMMTEEDDDETETISGADSAEEQLIPEAIDESLLVEQYQHDTINNQAANKPQDLSDHHNTANSDQAKIPINGSEAVMSSRNEFFFVEQELQAGNTEICSLGFQLLDCEMRHCDAEIVTVTSSEGPLVPTQRTRAENDKNTSSSSETTSTPDLHASREPTVSSSQDGLRGTHNTPAGSSSSSSNNSRKASATGQENSRTDAPIREVSRVQISKQPGSGTQPPPASPTMQESFFKSVQKRLQMLESNSSLSLQYIEEQSRALRDAFRKVEQRQLSKTGTFLEHLNQTVLNELREFRQQYDQLWQSTVIELELQRERYQQESQAMHARLGVLADELIFQRRVSILQMALILVCLGLVLFSRGAVNSYLELPLVQSVLAKSPSSKWINLTGDSRTTSPATTRIGSAYHTRSKQGILKTHRRGMSEDSGAEPLSASEMYSPPTPVSFDGYSDAELAKADSKIDDLDFDPIMIQRPSTSPPILPSAGDPSTPKKMDYANDVSIESRILTPTRSVGKDKEAVPEVKIEHPTPPGRHLTWDLPE